MALAENQRGCGEQPQPLESSDGAGNGIRTRDPNLGKVVLYQLSYSRIGGARYQEKPRTVNWKQGSISTMDDGL